jgi:hypothetical protein
MRRKEIQPEGRQYRFPDDADEALWAMRDYFWAIASGILDDPGRGTWRSFRAGYAHDGSRVMNEPDGPPGHPRRRAA